MKYICDACGAELKKTDKYCTLCGAKVKKDIDKDNNESKVLKEVVPEVKGKTDEIKQDKDLKNKDKENVKEEKVENNKKQESCKNGSSVKFTTILITVLITSIVTSLAFYLLFLLIYKPNQNIITENKNVTINDTGIAEAVDKVYDSVVVIKTYKNGSLYATGTGFVFEKDDKEAYILTNAHVVSSGDKFTATFTNNKEYEVEIVGSDTYADVAVLSTSSKNVISVAEIGSSEALKLGDTAFAVGAPLDADTYSWTVTRGVISGKNREVSVNIPSSSNIFSSEETVMEVLQTDTAINEGNSGGPLCNSNGEVIGITNMKLSSTTIEGIGFAIPIETAMSYAADMLNGKKITRPYLGISMYYVSPSLYRNVKVSGVYIESVDENGSAVKAGIKKGDIITKVDGKEIKSTAYFKYLLYKHDVNDTVTLTIIRNNKEQEIKVKLSSSNERS